MAKRHEATDLIIDEMGLALADVLLIRCLTGKHRNPEAAEVIGILFESIADQVERELTEYSADFCKRITKRLIKEAGPKVPPTVKCSVTRQPADKGRVKISLVVSLISADLPLDPAPKQ